MHIASTIPNCTVKGLSNFTISEWAIYEIAHLVLFYDYCVEFDTNGCVILQ